MAYSPFRKVDCDDTPVRMTSVEMERASALGLQIGEYVMPRKGPLAEADSFDAYHRATDSLIRLPFGYQDIREMMRERYASVVNVEADQMANLRNVEFWEFLITRIGNKGSSPGMPYHAVCTEARQIINDEVALTTVVREAIAVIETLAAIDPDELEAVLRVDPTFPVRSWLADLTRIFIKNEPHPLRKKVSGKWRNIKSVSFRDFLVDLFLFGTQDDAEIQNWRDIPSKPGLGLTDEGAASLLAYAEQRHLRKGTDASNWEASVLYDLLKMEAERRVDFCAPETRSRGWENAVRNRLRLDAHAVIMTSGGLLLQRVIPGQTLSGKKYTASMNSAVRVMLSLGSSVMASRSGAPIDLKRSGCMAMGDDAVEDDQCWALRKRYYKEWGFVLTDEDVNEGISFCSHHICRKAGAISVVPLAPEKALARVASHNVPVEETMENVSENFRHHPRCEELCDLVRDMATARAMKTKAQKPNSHRQDGEKQEERGVGCANVEEGLVARRA